MDIYPQDIGPAGQRVLQSRERHAYPAADLPMPPWMAWTGVGSACLLISVGVGVAAHSAGIGWAGVVVTGVIAKFTLLAQKGRGVPLRTEGPLTVAEVRDLFVADMDPLQRPYLKLLLFALGTPAPPEAESPARVREALRALGDSLAGLPPPAETGPRDSPEALRAQAVLFAAEAAGEADAVIGASLRRRAESLRRQAETAARTDTLLRRNEALRAEVAGQIGALQTSLTALRVGGAQAVYDLADVAASIHQVALEAGALTQARAEVGDAVAAPGLTAPDQGAPAVQTRAGATGTS